eukprot:scaffold874_cov126-Skeletonema_dohrnii-CCMP3373.AAC.4
MSTIIILLCAATTLRPRQQRYSPESRAPDFMRELAFGTATTKKAPTEQDQEEHGSTNNAFDELIKQNWQQPSKQPIEISLLHSHSSTSNINMSEPNQTWRFFARLCTLFRPDEQLALVVPRGTQKDDQGNNVEDNDGHVIFTEPELVWKER